MRTVDSIKSVIRSTRVIAPLWFICCVVSVPAAAQKVEHPLDPLSFQEYWAVLEVLRDAGHLDAETRFSIVNLREPPQGLCGKNSDCSCETPY